MITFFRREAANGPDTTYTIAGPIVTIIEISCTIQSRADAPCACTSSSSEKNWSAPSRKPLTSVDISRNV